MKSVWSSRFLYSALIGKERDGKPIPGLNQATIRLRKILLKKLGGTTLIKMKDVEGVTLKWGPENVRLILVITDNQEKADAVFASQEIQQILAQFRQEEIWIMRQPIALFGAKFGAGEYT